MIFFVTGCTLALFCLLSVSSASALVDKHESCEFWAAEKECETNPNYMLNNCAKACEDIKKVASAIDPNSFSSVPIYDVVGEKDIHGNKIDFNNFQGKVLYVINVASYCGYTAENYELFRKLQKYRSQGFEIIISPCNQFGNQEPGSSEEITSFASSQKFEGLILAKGDVNGEETRPLFKYLKEHTSKKHINWNFDGAFLVSRNGFFRRVTYGNVETEIQALLDQEL